VGVAALDERRQAVATQIGVDGDRIHVEACAGLEVGSRVAFGSRSDVAAFGVENDHQIVLATAVDENFENLKAAPSQLLEQRDLGLDDGDALFEPVDDLGAECLHDLRCRRIFGAHRALAK